MFGRIRVIAGPDQRKSYPLEEGQTLIVGRGQATQTRLTDLQVSRVHCQFEVTKGKIWLADGGSAAGTLLNGQKMERQEIKNGDVVRIGGTQLCLELAQVDEQSTMLAGALPSSPEGAEAKVGELAALVGSTISHYEIGPVLAKGQTGAVFRGRDTKNDRAVAIKILAAEFAKNEEEEQRFIRAMKTVMPLRHPNLVTVYGAGKSGPHCYIAMELIEGESARQMIERIGTAGMLDWRDAFRVALHVARALEFAHEKQIVHRNLTPQNILIRSSDKLTKLGDLVLAKALEGTMAQQITRPGQLVGPLAYMAPEQTHGSATGDTRSDIYSLGATVYALLTGRPPVEASSLVEMIKQIRQAEPVTPKKYQLAIPDIFEGVVMKMLAKRPADRFQTPTDLVTDLERVAKMQGAPL